MTSRARIGRPCVPSTVTRNDQTGYDSVKDERRLRRTNQAGPATSEDRGIGSFLIPDNLVNWGWVLAYSAVLTSISVLRFHLWIADGFDLGKYEQGLWQIFHGGLLARSTYLGSPILGWAASWILVFLSPLYIWGGVGLIFALQSAALGSGYWFIRRISVYVGLDGARTHLLGLVYLIFPTILGTNLFDFHPEVLAVPFLFLAILSALEEKQMVFLIGVLGAALTSEIALVAIIGLAATMAWQKRPRFAAFALTVFVAVSVIDTGLVPQLFGPSATLWQVTYGSVIGSTPALAAIALLRHPELLIDWVRTLRPWEYLVWLAAPLAGFLLLSWPKPLNAWWLAPLLIAETNMISLQPTLSSPFDQYSVLMVPFLFTGVAASLAATRRTVWRPGIVLVTPLACLLVFAWQQHRTYWRLFPQNVTTLQQVETLIPPGAPVATQNFIAAHFANRPQEWVLSEGVGVTWPKGTYLILDPASSTGTTSRALLAAVFKRIKAPGQAAVIFDQDGVMVYRLLEPMGPISQRAGR